MGVILFPFRRKGKENNWKKRIKYKIFLFLFVFLDLSL